MDDDVKKILEDHENRIATLEALFKAKPEAIEKRVSVREFILSKSPKTDDQKTLVIGYFLEKFEELSSFSVKDLRAGFSQAKEPLPSNINDTVNINIEKGYMMEAREKKDNKKAWNLTNSGERYVKNGLKDM